MEYNNKSPLRYPGGKSRACKKLDIILNDNFDITSFNCLVSPFFGGGSFEFYIQNKYKIEVVANDKFKPIYSFWNICKEKKEELCIKLYEHLGNIDKSDFTKFRAEIMDLDDELIQSTMYFVINRCSFSGATLSGGFSLESSKKRFTESSINRIKDLDLSKFKIFNIDFENFIEKEYNEKDTLLFLDPPYYLEKGSKLYGMNGDLHENFDHDRLHKCLSQKKNWIMTYNNCDYIKKLYEKYKIIETTWSYGMNKSKTSSEIVIIG